MIRLLHSHPFLQASPGHPLHPTSTQGRGQVPPVMCGCGVDILQPERSLAQWQIKELPRTHGAQQAWEMWRGWYQDWAFRVGSGEGSSQLKRHPDSWQNPPWDT